jgi:hypothetical protein
MAYTVNKTNNSASVSSYIVQDSVLNSETDLKFVGKGYSGYGEVIAENFLHLLENFSNTSAPSKPIKGQLWYDETNQRLKVYSGATFQPLGGATYQSTEPSIASSGDIWIDSDTDQMYFYNGTSHILVGPQSSTNSGLTFPVIVDASDNNQNVTQLRNNTSLVATIYDGTTPFTPKTAITGFPTIKPGITLTTAIANVKFNGTATNADALGNKSASSYLTADAADIMTGRFTLDTDDGMFLGDQAELQITVASNDVTMAQTAQDKDLIFTANVSASQTEMIRIDGSTGRIGIKNTTPTTELDVTGTVKATAFQGNVTGNVTGNVSGTATVSTTSTISADNTTNANRFVTFVNSATGNLGMATDTNFTYNPSTNVLTTTASSARYADLAETYETDSTYEVGTVVIFGGEKEITQSTISNDTRVAGVISENPAYLMNSESNGQPIALVGKVKCKVHGMVSKGDLLTTSGEKPGYAKKAITPVLGSIVGKAMETKDTAEESVILISVGRL